MTTLGGVNGTVCDSQQSQQALQSYNSRTPRISCITPGQGIGLALTTEAAFISCVCVLVMFIRIGWNVRWYTKNCPNRNWKLFQMPADIYMFSLFSFDFLQALGGALDVRWVHNGIVTTGHYCRAQGIIQQTGELGVALVTLLLAVHTFVTALWQVGLRARGVAFGLVCLVCIFDALWVGIGAGIHKNYEAPTPYWCWISPDFPGQRLGGEYVWMWVALFSSALLYIALFFWTVGLLSVDKESWYKLRMSKPDQRAEYAERRVALGMLLYPLAYSIVVLPTSITRWLQFGHHDVPTGATFFSSVLFSLSGAINVLLFLTFRPRLLLFPRFETEELSEPSEVELPRGAGPAISPSPSNRSPSPETTTTALPVADEGSRNGAAMPRVGSRRTDDA